MTTSLPWPKPIERQQQTQCLWFYPAVFSEFSADMFDPQYWQQRDAVVGQASGRGTTYFVEHGDRQLVLRHYYRGGLIGKLLKDIYFADSVHRTRGYLELKRLAQLRGLNLPVPKPCAARMVKAGSYYRADIIVERIPGARDLLGLLQEAPLSEDQWHAIGATIATFHNADVVHPDLNIQNILIDDQQQVWLIDFDKSTDPKGLDWQQKNLARLERSLVKQSRLHSLPVEPVQFRLLIDGYNSASAAPLDY